ncbi:MAG: Gmad2 immunoglobulin-like domain-containing protein [Acidimicrobiales bacterium]
MGSRRWLSTLVVVVVVAVAAFAAGYLVHSTTTTTTTSPPATTTTTTLDSTWVATWPTSSSTIRYATPTAAALGFATSVLHMTSPVARAFQRGDTRSGEVPIVTTTNGPVTTVLVRQLTSDNSWWVLGSACAAVNITLPHALDTVSSPLTLTGQSTAFEAVINYSLYQDDVAAPMVSGTAMGGSNGVMGPFSTTVTFAAPAHRYGVLVVYTRSAKDGSVLEASAIRVAF